MILPIEINIDKLTVQCNATLAEGVIESLWQGTNSTYLDLSCLLELDGMYEVVDKIVEDTLANLEI